jgi:hypothetical protein
MAGVRGEIVIFEVVIIFYSQSCRLRITKRAEYVNGRRRERKRSD